MSTVLVLNIPSFPLGFYRDTAMLRSVIRRMKMDFCTRRVPRKCSSLRMPQHVQSCGLSSYHLVSAEAVQHWHWYAVPVLLLLTCSCWMAVLLGRKRMSQARKSCGSTCQAVSKLRAPRL